MLTSLSIRDIVLIEALDLEFGAGLSVLTGETGAGKSILLDSLSLATGARAERTLVREGAETGRVIAAFEVAPDHAACRVLDEQGGDSEHGHLILKRQITRDGRSRAWINDMPVGQALLAQVGSLLVEIHGQNDDRGLMDPAGHRALLDVFASNRKELTDFEAAWSDLGRARDEVQRIMAGVEDARKDEDFLRYAVDELKKLAPQPGEEQTLADKRASMMQGEQLSADLSRFRDDLSDDAGIDAQVRGILRRMDRLSVEAQTILKPVMDSLDRAAIELSEAMESLDRIAADLEFDPTALEDTEARLFELRRLARKHSVAADDLSALLDTLENRLEALDRGDQHLAAAEAALASAGARVREAGVRLRDSREKAATILDAAVNEELPPLKLEKAAFRTAVSPLAFEDWGEGGAERVSFEVKTNPGTPFGPLTKIASGGETVRFILALKVVLGGRSSVPVMIFDEVDRGIGGATADAVGERLARLAKDAQVLVVTHSPQVAARGEAHMQIEKSDQASVTRTEVRRLDAQGRLDEIARMLAGAEITPEARAAARRLLSTAA